MKINNIPLQKLLLANFLLVILILSFLFIDKPLVKAQENSADAIAIRIIPNPNHLSAQKWYQLQGFAGSPQSLIVDGYKAVRDGRTVYVSASNVAGNYLYTNIYLISYNQEADSQTVDIFGRILKNWKFNTNLNESVGSCLISNQVCYEDSDCPTNYVCGNNGGDFSFQNNKCVLEEENYNNLTNTPNCLIDSDCPTNLFCTSLKSKIIRDLDRLENLILLREKIIDYNNRNGNFPILRAGTYLPNLVISTWPSWQNSLLSQLGVSSILDPVNKLGSCADSQKKFDLNTCWNAVDNVFVNNEINYSNFILPGDSYAISYVSNDKGSEYKLCATMETSLSGVNYSITDGVLSNYSCGLSSSVGNIGFSGSSVNNAPRIASSSLAGVSGTRFEGLLRAVDDEGDVISWVINFSPLSDFSKWYPANSPQIIGSVNSAERILFAEKAGKPGTYPVTVILSDYSGTSSTEVLNINITNTPPQITAGDVSFNLSYYEDFLGEIPIKTSGSQTPNISIKLYPCPSGYFCQSTYVRVDNKPCPANDNDLITSNFQIATNFWACVNTISPGNYSLKVKGKYNGFNNIKLKLGDYSFDVRVQDYYDDVSLKDFKVTVTANNPVINLNDCPGSAILNEYYECTLKTTNPQESLNSTFSILNNSLPAGLILDGNKIKGYPSSLGVSDIDIRAENEFGLSATTTLIFSVTTNCGSVLVNYAGGPWNILGTLRNHSGFYKTVLIGNQCWLKDNLNVGIFLPAGNIASGIIGKHCYDNDLMSCDAYGGLYGFTEALNIPNYCNSNDSLPECLYYNPRGICPEGWRIPSDDDWFALEDYLKDLPATCDSARNGWDCSDAGDKANLTTGFNNKWGGWLVYPNNFSGLNTGSAYWSSNIFNINRSLSRKLDSSSYEIERNNNEKSDGYSVRCIKIVNECQSDNECKYKGSTFFCDNGICQLPSVGN
ncbi:MAG: FISUMP domain-containing protein [Patescibacteria group bacterium]|jgi:uncharacterized protein (TIGR02145 family)